MKNEYKTSFSYHLRDGTEILLREIKADDKSRIQTGLELLSDNSVYTRFFRPIRRFSEKELIYLTEVDQINHVAWGVLSYKYPEIPGLGVCRFIRSKKYPDRAEFAITVIDDFQNKGVGTTFLALLYILASHHKISLLCGSALNTNNALIKRFEQIRAKTSWESGECEIHIPVFKDHSLFLNNKYSELFKSILKVFNNKLFN